MSAHGTIRNRLVGAFGQEDGTASAIPSDAWTQFFERNHSDRVAADATAATNTANTICWSNPYDYPVQLVDAGMTFAAAVTANATDYGTVTLYTDDGAGGTPVAAGTYNTATTGFSAGVRREFTLTPANCTIAAGANLYRNYTKAGNGVSFTAHTVSIRVQPI